jgi:uncharacterized iron-regulated membrane protein
MGRRIDLRRVWVQVHLWLGLTLGVVGALVGVTGSVLVYDRAIDGALNPQRYATSGNEIALTLADYAKRAASAAGEGARTVNLRLPATAGTPVVAFVRARGETAPPRRVYLDPPNGQVLDAPVGRGLIGWAHDLHESLSLREYNGREIVGVVGIAMLVSSLSGIYLWWPRRRLARRDFRFRRAFTLSRNLHYTFGFYGSLVLAMLAFTGIVLAFPEAGRVGGRALRERVALRPAACRPPSPPAGLSRQTKPRPSRWRNSERRAWQALDFRQARAASTASRCASRVTTASAAPPWSWSTRDRGRCLRQVDRATQTSGDAFLAFQRPLHEGDALGAAGRLMISVVGLLPALFVVTGSMMWLRSRRRR